MSRSLGWTLLKTRLPIEIVPEVMFSRPASMRSRVDLPQPDGPTRTTNSPSSIGIDTPCNTSKLPNDFRTSRICTEDIHFSLHFERRTTSAATVPLFFLPGFALIRSPIGPILSAVYTVLQLFD